jgi:uncharacterized protein YndB with AHSA1/START domain
MPFRRYRQFTKRIYVKASLDAVYKAWATAGGLARWFPRQAKYSSPEGRSLGTTGLAEEGGRYWMGWPGGVEEEGTVLETDPHGRFSFTFGKDIIVTVTLSKTLRGTLVEVVQQNKRKDEENLQVTLEYTNGWTFYLTNLKSVLEHSADLREARPDVDSLVNT